MIWLLALLASGSPHDTRLDAHVGGTTSVAGQVPRAFGIGAGLSLPVAGPLSIEARTEGYILADGFSELSAGPAVRLWFIDPQRLTRWRPSLHGGASLRAGGGSRAVLQAGLDLEVPRPEPGARLGVFAWTDGRQDAAIGVRIGVVARPWARKPTPMPVVVLSDDALVDTAPEPEPPVPSAAPRWWDPARCDWIGSDTGDGWAEGDGVRGPRRGGPGAGGTGAADGERAQGWLMVVARPGDVVKLGALDQTVGQDGVARLRAPEGLVQVQVVGGGRTQQFEAAIADGYALWLRARPPEEVQVRFGVGSSTVLAEDVVLAQALARNRGQYSLRISGSYSPEGNTEANLALANRRAQAVLELLTRVGVPQESIQVEPPTPPRAGLSAAQQRAVYIQPVSVQETP